jgi:hypothetical protein
MYIRTDIHPGNSGWRDSSGGGRISIPDISPPPVRWLKLNQEKKMKRAVHIMKAIVFAAILVAQNAAAEEIYPFEAGKWGYVSEQGKVVIEPQFEEVGFFTNGVATAKQGGKWGLIDTKGNWLAKPQFEKLEHDCKEIWWIENIRAEDGKRQYDFINSKGKIILSADDNQRLVCTGVNGMLIMYSGIMGGYDYGLYDKDGVEILKPEYDWISFRELDGFAYGVAKYLKKGEINSKYGVLDAHGKWIFKPEFHHINIENHYAFIQKEKGSNFGLYDLKNRKMVIDFILDDYGERYPIKEGGYSNTLYAIWKRFDSPQNGKYRRYGFVSIANIRIITPVYVEISENLSEGLIAVREENGKWGFVSEEAKVAINPRFEEVLFFENGLAGAKFEGKWGYINKKGEWVIAPAYSEVGAFDNGGLAPVRAIANSGGKWGFIDKKGEWIVPPAYSEVGAFDSEGLAPVAKITDRRHAYGIVNRAGEELFPPNSGFERIGPFASNGLASASFFSPLLGWVYGYIDKKGKWAIKPRYRSADNFNDCGIAFVQTGGAWEGKYIDSKGKTIRLPEKIYFSSLSDYCKASQGAFITADGSVHPKIMNLFKNNYIFSVTKSYNPKVAFVGIQESGERFQAGLIDDKGNMLINPMPDIYFKNPFDKSDFARIHRIIEKDNKIMVIVGIINIKGEFVFDIGDYDIDGEFCEKGFARIKRQKDGKWGLINREYKIVVEPQYDDIHHTMMWHNNLFLATRKDEKTGFERQYWLDKNAEVRFHTDRVEGRYVIKNAAGEILWQSEQK